MALFRWRAPAQFPSHPQVWRQLHRPATILPGYRSPSPAARQRIRSAVAASMSNAIADHPRRIRGPCAFLREDARQQIRLAVARVFGPVAVNCIEVFRDAEFLQNAHGKVLVLRRAHVERKALAVQLCQHLGDAGIRPSCYSSPVRS